MLLEMKGLLVGPAPSKQSETTVAVSSQSPTPMPTSLDRPPGQATHGTPSGRKPPPFATPSATKPPITTQRTTTASIHRDPPKQHPAVVTELIAAGGPNSSVATSNAFALMKAPPKVWKLSNEELSKMLVKTFLEKVRLKSIDLSLPAPFGPGISRSQKNRAKKVYDAVMSAAANSQDDSAINAARRLKSKTVVDSNDSAAFQKFVSQTRRDAEFLSVLLSRTLIADYLDSAVYKETCEKAEPGNLAKVEKKLKDSIRKRVTNKGVGPVAIVLEERKAKWNLGQNALKL